MYKFDNVSKLTKTFSHKLKPDTLTHNLPKKPFSTITPSEIKTTENAYFLLTTKIELLSYRHVVSQFTAVQNVVLLMSVHYM